MITCCDLGLSVIFQTEHCLQESKIKTVWSDVIFPHLQLLGCDKDSVGGRFNKSIAGKKLYLRQAQIYKHTHTFPLNVATIHGNTSTLAVLSKVAAL